MLSVDIIETLFVGFDQILAIGRFDDFLKNSEGEKISTSEWVGNAVEEFFKSVLGDEAVEEIKVKYQKFNRIYQATANLLNAFQSIAWSILEALEVLGQWIAKIGNALKKYGVVFERAYAWMNPTPDFHNKLFTKLEQAENLVSNLVQVTSSIQEVDESIQYFNQARTELKNQLELSPPNPERDLPDNRATLGDENLRAAQSAAPPIEETDLSRPEEDDAPT
jgi:DNA repair ATPase RecN